MNHQLNCIAIIGTLFLQLPACSNDASPSQGAGGTTALTAGSGAATAASGNGSLGGAGVGGGGSGGSPSVGGNAGNPTGGGGQGAGGSPAAGSSGMVGQSGSGAGGGAASSTSCGAAKICDDFESYASDTMPGGIWKFLGPDSKYTDSKTTIAVDSSKAFSGKQALHVKAPDSWGGAWIGTTVGLPLPNNIMW